MPPPFAPTFPDETDETPVPGAEMRTELDLQQFQPQLKLRARRMMGDRLRACAASSDLVQDTLLTAVRRFAEISGRPPRVVWSWLVQTLRHRILNEIRKQNRSKCTNSSHPEYASRHDLPLQPQPLTSAFTRIARKEIRESILKGIDRLPSLERIVLLGIYEEELTPAVLGVRLGRSEASVRSLQHRGLTRLRTILAAHGDGT